MDGKKTFYVSVGSKQIVDEADEINFDFEIKATDEEIDKLAELFEVIDESDEQTHFRALLPFKEYHKDKETTPTTTISSRFTRRFTIWGRKRPANISKK